jgi:hypothetical protein
MTIILQPVIPLPEVVPVVTGEEQEEVLYCQRAKLYRFVDGEWKERGIGDFKILRHKTDKSIRYLQHLPVISLDPINAQRYNTVPEMKFMTKIFLFKNV